MRWARFCQGSPPRCRSRSDSTTMNCPKSCWPASRWRRKPATASCGRLPTHCMAVPRLVPAPSIAQSLRRSASISAREQGARSGRNIADARPRSARLASRRAGHWRSEYEGIICGVLGRQLFPSRHHFERINLTRCASNTGFALWDRPSCDESHDQSGNTDSEQSLSHLKSPRLGSGPSNRLDGRN
jgi:hypothetical protein